MLALIDLDIESFLGKSKKYNVSLPTFLRKKLMMPSMNTNITAAFLSSFKRPLLKSYHAVNYSALKYLASTIIALLLIVLNRAIFLISLAATREYRVLSTFHKQELLSIFF